MDKNKVGRPKIELTEDNWLDIENMMQAGCSGKSIADKFQISYDTLSLRIQERYKTDFTYVSQQKKETGIDLLKQRAFQLALSSNPGSITMLIFLLKAKCGYKEKHDESFIGFVQCDSITFS